MEIKSRPRLLYSAYSSLSLRRTITVNHPSNYDWIFFLETARNTNIYIFSEGATEPIALGSCDSPTGTFATSSLRSNIHSLPPNITVEDHD